MVKILVHNALAHLAILFVINSVLHEPKDNSYPGVVINFIPIYNHSKMAITLSPEHGYVVLAVSGSFVLNMWQMMKIGNKRKELGIQYPQMYSDKHPIFNCYQRAHQNTLEATPFYLALVLTGGLRHPMIAAGAGAIYLAARIIYSLGYYTGNPKSRIPGAIMNFLALITLFGCSVSTGAGLLGWW